MVWRSVMAWLWQWQLVRWLVLCWVRWGLPGSDWLAVNTPLLWCLRRLFLDAGDYRNAAACARQMRRLEGGV